MAVNIVEFGNRESIERQAREWLVRMDGDAPLTKPEKQALKEWMSRSAFHAGELTRLARLWDRANIMTALLAGLESQRRERKNSPEQQRKKTALSASWKRTTLLAASVLLTSVVLIYCSLRLAGVSFGP